MDPKCDDDRHGVQYRATRVARLSTSLDFVEGISITWKTSGPGLLRTDETELKPHLLIRRLGGIMYIFASHVTWYVKCLKAGAMRTEMSKAALYAGC
jgi:hypothetical protein